MTEARVRSMTAADVPAVVELETASFSAPWSESTFHTLLDRESAELLVLTEGSDVVGYAVLWCVVDQGELANIAIRADRRGSGLGARLLKTSLERSVERGVRTVFLEVRESNAAARELYARFGFREIGIRRDYYDDPREDARILRAELERSVPES